jgi:[glutamine synthetase] adenylyltransferase / [glutamine synthetase]-adenylyl-L-tyrosine phosphorylase
VPTPSDLFLSADLTEDQARAYLQSLGFRDAAAVDEQLQRMADDLVAREALGRLAPDLIPAILESPNPDGAVAAIAQYVASRSGRAMFLDYLREDPRALHVLTYVMGASPQLGDILVRTPEYFHWLVAQVERSAPDRQDHEEELVSAFDAIDDPVEGLNMLRRWKRREMLRIGTRDLLRYETVPTASAQLSDVAAVAIDFTLAIVMQQQLDAASRAKPPGTFAVIGTGSLGGREMGYDAGVELLYVFDAKAASAAEASSAAEFFVGVGQALTDALVDERGDGPLYSVGLAPWAQGDHRLRASSLDDYSRHYATADDLGERLALTRARPIAGDADLGARFLAACQPFVYRDAAAEPAPSPAGHASRAAHQVEALTQTLQLAHGSRHVALRSTGTLATLEELGRMRLLPEHVCRELDHAYVFLRTAEHRTQLGLKDPDLEKQALASQARVREICKSLGKLTD